MARALGARRHLSRERQWRKSQVLRLRDAAVSVRRSARRPRKKLCVRRRDRTDDAHARLRRAPPDGLGCVRAARRKRRHCARHRPRRLDRREHRQYETANPADRNELRLDARDHHVLPRVLPLESVAVSAALRGWFGVQARSARELVPKRSRPSSRTSRSSTDAAGAANIWSSGATFRSGFSRSPITPIGSSTI